VAPIRGETAWPWGSSAMPRATVGLILLLVAGLGAPAGAAEWGAIIPGASTTASVRAQYGAPTKATSVKIEAYDTDQWVYEGTQAPAGTRRVTVDFGLLSPTGFNREVVRTVRVEPNPGVFTRDVIVAGWGEPNRVSPVGQPPSFVYVRGLIVGFDDQGWNVEWMVFTPPQPEAPGGRQP
jgi:hypothetical protein